MYLKFSQLKHFSPWNCFFFLFWCGRCGGDQDIKSDLFFFIYKSHNVDVILCILYLFLILQEGISMTEVSRKYEHEFFNDMAALNVLPPTFVPHVTDNIDTIIQYIDRIMKKRCAYVTPSGK